MRSIAHISDLHFGRLDRPVAQALAEDLRANPPTLLVVSGDFTQRARVGQYTAAAEYIARLPGPQIVVPGNHDVPMYNVIRRFFYPLDRYLKHISTDLSPAYQDEQLFVLGQNTARSFTQKSGWLRKPQLAEICERFRQAPGGVMKVLVTHHPFIPPPHDRYADIVCGARDALGQLGEAGVDLLLAGHLHRAYHEDVRTHHVSVRHSILSIQAGTTTSTRRRHEPNSYNWITIDGGQVTVEVRMWTGEKFSHRQITQFQKSDVWRKVGG